MNIDLEPHQFAERDAKTGKLKRRLSKTFCRNYAFFCLAVLAFIFWNRAGFGPDVLFGLTALFAAIAGVFAANWLYDVF